MYFVFPSKFKKLSNPEKNNKIKDIEDNNTSLEENLECSSYSSEDENQYSNKKENDVNSTDEYLLVRY